LVTEADEQLKAYNCTLEGDDEPYDAHWPFTDSWEWCGDYAKGEAVEQ
jgi:hypothetical protein